MVVNMELVFKVILTSSGPDIDRECLAHTLEIAIEDYKREQGLTMEEDTDHIRSVRVEVQP